MRFAFRVEVELRREQGRFASRGEMADQLVEALEQADPGSLTGENDGEYSVDDWSVSDISNEGTAPALRRRKVRRRVGP